MAKMPQALESEDRAKVGKIQQKLAMIRVGKEEAL